MGWGGARQARLPSEREDHIGAPQQTPALYRLGLGAITLLAFALPFDAVEHPLFATVIQPVTDLDLIAALAVLPAASTVLAAITGVRGPSGAFRRRLVWTALVLAALIAASALAGHAAHRLGQTLSWLLDLLAAGMLAMALPLWLADDPGRRTALLVRSFIAGALIAAIVGFAEFWLGARLEHRLVWFRPGPTLLGPYLRLTSTFHHANEAAMYFDLALPFALVGLARALNQRAAWPIIAAWGTTLGALLLALLLTYSRGGVAALVAAVVVMVVAGRRALPRPRLVRRGTQFAAIAVLPVCAFLASTMPIDVLRLDAQNDTSWYQAAYVATVPGVMKVNQERIVPVTVANRSPLPWVATGPTDYTLSYHWLYPSWKVAQFDTKLTPMRGRIDPGGHRTVPVSLRAPGRPGRYLLVWDLLWHRSTWFGLKTGAFHPYAVRVLPAPDRAAATHARLPATAEHITALPLAQTADRTQIWRAAVAIIAHHPLLGLGPHGFRRNYAAAVPPSPHGRTPPPSNAHNLLLELMADWGIPTAALFLLLLAIIWWPLCATASRGMLTNAWHLAGAGAGAAFIVQSAVECYLGTPAIFLAGALLCGLALSARRASIPHG